jgi:hypothetical protein
MNDTLITPAAIILYICAGFWMAAAVRSCLSDTEACTPLLEVVISVLFFILARLWSMQ